MQLIQIIKNLLPPTKNAKVESRILKRLTLAHKIHHLFL